MLFPSQTQAKDSLKTSLGQSAAVQLQGLSGSGKSLIAKQALEGREGIGIESKKIDSGLAEIKDAVARKVRVVVLAQVGTDTKEVSDEIGVPEQVVKVRGLTVGETGAWLDGIEPAVTGEEREHVLRYSLGIPLLIERLCSHRPIAQVSALTHCVVYLQSLIEECHLGGEVRDNELRRILADYTDFAVPDDVLSRLADCEWQRRGSTPMTTLHSRLRPGSELPTPVSLQIFELYEEWLRDHPDEPDFDVFVQEVPDAETLLQSIGYCQHPERDSTLKRFIFADARKGATFFSGRFDGFSRQMDNSTTDSDSYLYPIILKLARASGMTAKLETKEVFRREVCVLKLEGSQKSLYLHKHDHTPNDVMPVAYTVECALQQLGVSYMVQYNGKPLRYDPQKKCYELVEALNVDYLRERYGELEDDDELGDE